MPTIRNLPQIRQQDAKTYEALSDLGAAIDTISQQTNASPNSETPAPPAPTSLTVTGGNSIFDAAITDTNVAQYRGLEYFLEWSTEPGFSAPYTIHMGPSRNWRGSLGPLTAYFRVMAQYPTSTHSTYTYFGSQGAPVAVSGGGSTAPAPQPSAGSGIGAGPGGYGKLPYTTVQGRPPVRV